MAGTTSPDNIPYMTTLDGVIDTAYTESLADAVQDALAVRAGVYNYRWANAAARTAQTGMSVGDRGFQVDTGVEYRYSGSAWVGWESPWISYTATLGGFAVGTGGSAASATWYKYSLGRVKIKFVFVFGSSGATFPTGATVTLPSGITMRAPYWANEAFAACALLDASTASTFAGLVVYNSTDVDKFRINYKNGFLTTASLSTTAPWTWVAGDGIAGEFEYDPA